MSTNLTNPDYQPVSEPTAEELATEGWMPAGHIIDPNQATELELQAAEEQMAELMNGSQDCIIGPEIPNQWPLRYLMTRPKPDTT